MCRPTPSKINKGAGGAFLPIDTERPIAGYSRRRKGSTRQESGNIFRKQVLALNPGSIFSGNKMHDLIYLIGLIVVVMFILGALGLR